MSKTATQSAAQVAILIVKAARAAGKMDVVDVEAVLAEISVSKRIATITLVEVAELIEQRYPAVKEVELVGDVGAPSFQELLKEMGTEIPSGRRILVAFAAAFITGACIGYVGSMALAWLIAGAVLLGAGAFLTFLITVICWLVMIVTSYLAGKKVGAYILTGTVDEHFASVKRGVGSAWNWITSPFSSDDAVTA